MTERPLSSAGALVPAQTTLVPINKNYLQGDMLGEPAPSSSGPGTWGDMAGEVNSKLAKHMTVLTGHCTPQPITLGIPGQKACKISMPSALLLPSASIPWLSSLQETSAA